jgi:predicted GH43/DUF377 family glycosyl hydrolase
MILMLAPSIFTALSPQVSAVQQSWVKFPGNPILGPSPNAWDAGYVIQPRVLYNATSYSMWYVGASAGEIGIGYATSLDGFTWTKHSGPVLVPGQAGTWDSYEVELGSVIWNGTRLVMYYRGRGPRFESGAIGLATSIDGITWSKYANNPILRPTSVDARFMNNPAVVEAPSLWGMWYVGRSASDPSSSQILRILYATSLDGIHWMKNLPGVALQPSSSLQAWDSGSVYSPTVFFDGTLYGMWYAALNQTFLVPSIGFANSKDGASWTKFSENPVLTPGTSGSWDALGVQNPTIVLGGNGFMLYYDGIGETGTGSIGLAQPPSGFTMPEYPSSLSLLLGMALLSTILILTRKGIRRA